MNEVSTRVDPMREMLVKMKDEIAVALPSHMDSGHFARVILTAIKSNPKLLQCTPISLMSSVMLSAQIGLEPGQFGHCYLIPYKNKGTLECQFQIGYRGMVELVRRSGEVSTITAEAVHEQDHFIMHLGTDQRLEHTPFIDGDRGAMKGVYAVAKMKDGGVQFCWMSKSELDKHKSRFSRASQGSPWDTDYAEMAKKTVLKRLCKLLPLNVEIMRQVSQDGLIKRHVSAHMTDPQDDEDAAWAELAQTTAETAVPESLVMGDDE